MIDLNTVIARALEKWRNPDRGALGQCAFCFDAEENSEFGDCCSRCRIDHAICDEGGHKGLIGEYRAVEWDDSIGALPAIQRQIIAKLEAMLK